MKPPCNPARGCAPSHAVPYDHGGRGWFHWLPVTPGPLRTQGLHATALAKDRSTSYGAGMAFE